MTVKYKSLDNFSYLQGGPVWGQIIFVGDHQDAERCKILVKTKVERNWRSQWHSRFQEGYRLLAHPFAGGRFFDLERRTVNGKAAYIFEHCEAIDILYRRLRAIRRCRRYTKILPAGDLFCYAELVLGGVNVDLRVWHAEDWARRQIWQYLPALGLTDLELLVEAGRPSEETAEPGLRLKAS